MKQRHFYFTTRDLMMMAALAALGGVTSTYVNAVGDFFQSVLGFAGTTQWAAGLHVLWLILAVGLTRKQGSGTITGVLKGVVELLTGNTHGLLVVLVDTVAGLLVDLGFLPFRRKDSLVAMCCAGGLASASNVFVFQLFASIPTDSLAYWAILLIAGVAFLSGVLFAGVIGRLLLNALRRAGVVKDAAPIPMKKQIYPIFLVGALLLTAILTLYLRQVLRGPPQVYIDGAVNAPYAYPEAYGEAGNPGTASGDSSRVLLRDLLEQAQVHPDATLLLVRASDDYAFFITMSEIADNKTLFLASQGDGEQVSYNIIGAQNNKAWVRGVEEMVVVSASALEINGGLEHPGVFNPDEWQYDMDSTGLNFPGGMKKCQGVPLTKVLEKMHPLPGSEMVLVQGVEDSLSLPLPEVMKDSDLGLYTIIRPDGLVFALGRVSGEVLVAEVTQIEVQ
ncbi:MAG: ECF transporter S component [Anaerolineae bacterium]|nr:ECF transporter S component [Anaerolineae bacterium]